LKNKKHFAFIVSLGSTWTTLYCQSVNQLVSILSMFHAKFLHAQIPKAQKKTDSLTVFFMLLGSGAGE